MRRLLNLAFLASLLLAPACSNAQTTGSNWSRQAAATGRAPAVPLTGRVTDAANVLTSAQRTSLSAKLEQLEKANGHQLVVATVPTLGGRDVADFARDLANSWGIGRKGYNDGVVLLVAPNERKVRIAVGYGLERRLTHALCRQIIDQKILPHFRRGDLPGGIEAGADSLIARLQ